MTVDFCSMEDGEGHQCIREAGHEGRHRCFHGLIFTVLDDARAAA